MAYNNTISIPVDNPERLSSEDSVNLPEISSASKIINKSFGNVDDYIEVHIYNSNNQLLESDLNFTEYTFPENTTFSSEILVDPNKILSDRGYISGQFRIKINILKNKIFNTNEFPFIIDEISRDRREVKATAPKTSNNIVDPATNRFISEIGSSVYFKEFSLNLGNDILIPCINILLDKTPKKHEILFKSLERLSSRVLLKSSFKVVEEIVDPIFIDIDLGDPQLINNSIELREPNFNVDIRQNNSVPSSFKNYDSLLNYSITSSYQHLLSRLKDDGANLNIQYDYIRPVSESVLENTYHFENFVHFSNAEDRLRNFEYKLKLIELYDSQIGTINQIPTSSAASLSAKNNINEKKEKLIEGFDGYEQFLYFTSGSKYTWPKQTTSKPYLLYSLSSSEAKNWLGDSAGSIQDYGGQLLSASLYDKQNVHNLNKIIPEHIKANLDNSFYVTLTSMVGQHFDQIWTYIKAFTEKSNAHNVKGISKDTVYHQLKSLGIETFDQFENSDLIEYILGEGQPNNTVGSLTIGNYIIGGNDQNFYTTSDHETLVTASNAGSIPKEDITKEIWKRLYHNAPYLLKTKGTERGIKALMSCYGVPSTILNIKEYGGSSPVSGPLKDLDTSDVYKTFSYEKSGLALKGNSGTTGFFIKTNWSSSLTDALSASAKTVEFRIKPNRTVSNEDLHLLTLSGSDATKDPTLILSPYTGNDISASGDSTQYGKIDLYINNSIAASTTNFPVYNGNFWNIHIGTLGTSGSASNIQFGAYQSNFNKNVSSYLATTSQTEADRQLTFGDPFNGGSNIGGALHAYFGGIPSNTNAAYNTVDVLRYSGSLQEIRYHYGEFLVNNTFKKHALEPFMYAGNSLTSSFDNIVLRLPLGSNDQQDSSSFHPNIDVDYLGTISSNMDSQEWEEVIETHHLPTPDTVGASMTSEKVRIDEGTIDDNVLVTDAKVETSTLDRQPQDFEDLGIFFSPTNEMNEDILYTLGSFRLDDFIGSPLPSAQTSSKYEDLKEIKDFYFKKVKRRFNYFDYIKLIQNIDHTLFKVIEQFVPFKANTKTGLLIEPHFLERSKFARELPARSDGQTGIIGTHQTFEASVNGKVYSFATSSNANTISGQHDPGSYVISHNNLSFVTSSKTGERIEKGTNGTIEIYDDYLNPTLRDENSENNHSAQAPITPFLSTKPANYRAHTSNTILGNATDGKKSKKYYKYKEYGIGYSGHGFSSSS